MKRLKSDDTLDRLSELHNSLIFMILSLLPMRDVVKTTILSKRWKDLWFTLPCLNFVETNKNSVDCRNFINRALMLWKGTEIEKFKIRFEKSYISPLYGDMDLWVCFAKERKVEDLCIEIPAEYPMPYGCYGIYQPPQCLYSCSSIRKLSLIACNLQIRGNVHWEQLRSLKIHTSHFTEDLFKQLVSSSPQLEVFIMRLYGLPRNLSIRSSSLKKLSIYTSQYYPSSNYTGLKIWAPKLEALEISGAVNSMCLLTDVSSLTDVTLGILDEWVAILERTARQILPNFHDVLGETLRQILPTIQHVEAVMFSACCFKMLGVMKGEYSFPRVKLLRFRSGPFKASEIVGFLGIFPKVERLVIDCELDANENTFLQNVLKSKNIGEVSQVNGENYLEEASILMMQLKTVEINWCLYEASIFQFIEFVLEHATKIEKIVIQKKGNKVVNLEDMFLAAQKVVSLQKSFPTVEFILRKT